MRGDDENVRVRRWSSDHMHVLSHFIPKSWNFGLYPPHFYEDVEFYRKDVKYHKKQVDNEIVAFWKVDGLSTDVKRYIVNEFIKRPVTYGAHLKKTKTPKKRWELALILGILISLLLLLFMLKVENEIIDIQPVCNFVCTEIQGKPPTCDYICEK